MNDKIKNRLKEYLKHRLYRNDSKFSEFAEETKILVTNLIAKVNKYQHEYPSHGIVPCIIGYAEEIKKDTSRNMIEECADVLRRDEAIEIILNVINTDKLIEKLTVKCECGSTKYEKVPDKTRVRLICKECGGFIRYLCPKCTFSYYDVMETKMHNQAICKVCGSFISFIPKDKNKNKKSTVESIYHLDTIIQFGNKHRGTTIKHVIENDPDYIRWLFTESYVNFKLDAEATKKLTGK